MNNNFMIIKTKKLSAKEVKKKFHDFVDELADGCGPELEQEAESLKKHGDEFIEQLSGAEANGGGQFRGNNGGGQFRNDGGYMNNGGYPGGGQFRGNNGGMNRGGYWKDDQQQKMQRIEQMERELQELKMQFGM